MNQNDPAEFVIPALTRNPAAQQWIPAFAGMARLSIVFNMTPY